MVSDRNIESGLLFESPTSVALDSANNSALITDDILDALVIVDLSSGDRTVKSAVGVGTGPMIGSPTSVVIDADNNRALVVDTDLDALVSIDLVSGDRTVISDRNTGVGPDFGRPLSVAFDASNNRALVADGVGLVTLYWVDLVSGDRVVASDFTNSGTVFLNAPSVVLDQTHARAFVADVALEGLLVVELGTGQRAIAAR